MRREENGCRRNVSGKSTVSRAIQERWLLFGEVSQLIPVEASTPHPRARPGCGHPRGDAVPVNRHSTRHNSRREI